MESTQKRQRRSRTRREPGRGKCFEGWDIWAPRNNNANRQRTQREREKESGPGQAHRAVKRSSHKRHKTPTFCCLVVVRHTRCITKRIHKSRTFKVVASLCRTDRLLTLEFSQPVAHDWRARQAQSPDSLLKQSVRDTSPWTDGAAREVAVFFLSFSLLAYFCWLFC